MIDEKPADPRSAYRYGDKKDDPNYNTGFRVARTLRPEGSATSQGRSVGLIDTI
jgi:hypothetical protein